MNDGHAQAPAQDAAWDGAPVGLLRLDADGTVRAANALARSWLHDAGSAAAGGHVTGLFSVGGRIYWETHLAPLLTVEGRVDEVALELRTTPRRPVLLSATTHPDGIDVALSSAGERIRFERELQAARTSARTSERQVRALQSVTSALSQAVGVGAVCSALLGATTEVLGAGGATLWLTGADGGLERWGSAGTADLDLDAARAAPDTLLLPLEGQRSTRGALALAPRTGAGADPLDRQVCAAVAQQAGLALDRAHTYEESAEVARQLQRALLATEPPPDPRYAVASVYRPGVASLEVGGDFFDLFLAAPGRVRVVVGDVVGRGLSAAGAMGQLRSAVRAVSDPAQGPGEVLEHLDRFVDQVAAAAMATLVVADLELATGRVRYACAGHPPPLLVTQAEASLLWQGRSTPLGSVLRLVQRAQAEVTLGRGDRLLLCTDGLFERRGRDLDDGLRALVTAVGGARGPLGDAVHDVVDTLLVDEDVRDDVCVVLLQWQGDRFERELRGDLTGLSAARASLSSWLAARGVVAQVRDDLVLATSEALGNAGEHGARWRPEHRIDLCAELRPAAGGGDEVLITVHDAGSWRAGPSSSPDRGRGLRIVRALVDDLEVRSGVGTTVVLRRSLERAR